MVSTNEVYLAKLQTLYQLTSSICY